MRSRDTLADYRKHQPQLRRNRTVPRYAITYRRHPAHRLGAGLRGGTPDHAVHRRGRGSAVSPQEVGRGSAAAA